MPLNPPDIVGLRRDAMVIEVVNNTWQFRRGRNLQLTRIIDKNLVTRSWPLLLPNPHVGNDRVTWKHGTDAYRHYFTGENTKPQSKGKLVASNLVLPRSSKACFYLLARNKIPFLQWC
ncbi:unnamed protein product [Arabidopsis thaliana]|uniref:(thale cress) hypothetical protein n=1 Tax=Arabidopsis thaliana TaxID=3702 RepID=A0A7G2F1E1_ARATH|nr:unnamed protein product [Arabidopsis thaliana]